MLPRIALRLRSRPYSTIANDSDTKRAEASLKRFWKTVQVVRRDDGLVVTLDKRPLKTPGGKLLLLPHSKPLAGALIAHEWDSQKTVLKPHALPLTSLASRAIDAMTEESSRSETHKTLLEYLDTDAICFHDDDPPPLVTLQDKHWDPLLAWARETFQIELQAFKSLVFQPQPAESKRKLLSVMQTFSPWQLAALERVTMSSKSFIIGLAVVKRHLNVEQAAQAAHVEVNSQIERWGEVEDTHDIDYRDVRRQLGSAACLLSEEP